MYKKQKVESNGKKGDNESKWMNTVGFEARYQNSSYHEAQNLEKNSIVDAEEFGDNRKNCI